MKPLLYIVVTLTLVWVSHGAPQPLALMNKTTISDLSDSTTVDTSEKDVSNDNLRSTTFRPDNIDTTTGIIVNDKIDELSSISTPNIESGSEFSLAREDAEIFTNDTEDANESTSMSSLPNSNIFIDSKSTETSRTETKDTVHVTTETTVFKTTAEDDDVVKTELPILRYVPPLDPMKHMLMMADIKKIPKVPNFSEKINSTPDPTSEDAVSEIAVSTTDNASTESPDVVERVVAESSEVEEKLEPVVTETTAGDVVSSTVLLKSEDLSSEKYAELETSSDSSNTESVPETWILVTKAAIDSTEKSVNEDEGLSLIKNSETVLNTDDATTEREREPEIESEATAEVFSTTEEAIKVEELASSENLLKNLEEMKLETTILESETTTYKTISTTEADISLKHKDGNSTTEIKDTVFTTSTTVVPETTFESSTGITPSVSEKKNITLDDELEFRAVKLPPNSSKVAYVEREPVVIHEIDEVASSTQSIDDTEFTTSNILTTIAEMFFSSSSEDPITEKESSSESHESVTVKEEPSTLYEDTVTEKEDSSSQSEEFQTTALPLSVDKTEIPDPQSDSGVVLANDPADMLKVQSANSGLDSVPAKESSTDAYLPETTVTDSPPEELSDEQSVKSAELEPEKDNLETSSENIDDTVTSSPINADVSSTETNPSTIAATTVSETVVGDLEDKVTEISGSEPEIQNDPSSEENPSDYLLIDKDRYVSGDNKDMVAAVQFLHYHDKASSEQCFKLVDAHWNYATNLTEENKKKQLEQTLEYSLFHKEAWKNATSFAWKSFNDTLLKRWFKSLSVLGTAALPEDKLNEFNRLKAEMKNTYSTAKVCGYVSPQAAKKGQIIREKDCGLTLEPDLQRTLTKSRDYDELVHVWKSWRDAAGKPIRDKYLRFVNLSNEAAKLNGFADTGDMWREAYESETFEADLEKLWDQLKPLYEHLHAFVRRRLILEYGTEKIKPNGPIPAHLFGNMWAQSWVSLLDIMQPFPGKPSVDVTPIMEAKNMSAHEMFKISEEFFVSLGLKPMPEPFWTHSLIEKPKDREIICHASAWDFCNGRDYRIKQCTDITMEDLITVHHEMGHIQYFLQYSRQPNVFREGANPGFHEAIGDVLALSVSTPKHLKSIGLLNEVADDPEGDLNFLLHTALDKVAFLPSGYLIDLWRWGLFSGDIKAEEMNTKWWELRLKYQGICPPVKRTDTDFDPGAKFHVPGNVPYIRYFVSFVIQFQFHKVLCDASGHTGPLYKCDVYRSKEAGQILSQVMELGSSEHWSEAMKIMTGGATNKMDAGPILEYFEPLLDFLKEQNQNETLGWKSDDVTICP